MKSADDVCLALTQLVVSRKVTAQEIVDFVNDRLGKPSANNYHNSPFLPIAMTAASLERSEVGDYQGTASNLWRLAGLFAAAQFIFDMKRSLGLVGGNSTFKFELGADDFVVN